MKYIVWGQFIQKFNDARSQEEYNAASTPGDAADASDIHEGIGRHVERHVDPAERDWHIKVRERMR